MAAAAEEVVLVLGTHQVAKVVRVEITQEMVAAVEDLVVLVVT